MYVYALYMHVEIRRKGCKGILSHGASQKYECDYKELPAIATPPNIEPREKLNLPNQGASANPYQRLLTRIKRF